MNLSMLLLWMSDMTEREEVESRVGQVWDTKELQADFDVLGFCAPHVVVKRKADGVAGSLEFTHMPRYYFQFEKG